MAGQSGGDAAAMDGVPAPEQGDERELQRGDGEQDDFDRLLDQSAKRHEDEAAGDDMTKSFGFPVFRPEP